VRKKRKKDICPSFSFSTTINRRLAMNEQYYDALLNIKTTGEQKGFNDSFHYHRYEPTP
jgi:hypothetical protein